MTDASPMPTYHSDGTVAVITMDDGKANAMSTAVVETLDGYLDRALEDGSRALVLAGRPGMFSAGFNLEEMTASDESMRALASRGGRFMLRLYAFDLPTVAAATGHALAGGAILLLSCDVRIGADVPAKIGLNEVALGMTLPKFAVELARDRIAPRALDAATMQATIYDAAGAAEVGYLDRVVPADEVVDAAVAEARRLTELRTGAYAGTKKQLRRALVTTQSALIDEDMATITAPRVAPKG